MNVPKHLLKAYTKDSLEWSKMSEAEKSQEAARLRYVNKKPILAESERKEYLVRRYYGEKWSDMTFAKVGGLPADKIINIPNVIQDRPKNAPINLLLFYSKSGKNFIETFDGATQKYGLNSIELRRVINETSQSINVNGEEYIVIGIEDRKELIQVMSSLGIKNNSKYLSEKSSDSSDEFEEGSESSSSSSNSSKQVIEKWMDEVDSVKYYGGELESIITEELDEVEDIESLDIDKNEGLLPQIEPYMKPAAKDAVRNALFNFVLDLNKTEPLKFNPEKLDNPFDLMDSKSETTEGGDFEEAVSETTEVPEASSVPTEIENMDELADQLKLKNRDYVPENVLKDVNYVFAKKFLNQDVKDLIVNEEEGWTKLISDVKSFQDRLADEKQKKAIKEVASELNSELKYNIEQDLADLKLQLELLSKEFKMFANAGGPKILSSEQKIQELEKTLNELVTRKDESSDRVERDNIDNLLAQYDRIKNMVDEFEANEIIANNNISKGYKNVLEQGYSIKSIDELLKLDSYIARNLKVSKYANDFKYGATTTNFLQNIARDRLYSEVPDMMKQKKSVINFSESVSKSTQVLKKPDYSSVNNIGQSDQPYVIDQKSRKISEKYCQFVHSLLGKYEKHLLKKGFIEKTKNSVDKASESKNPNKSVNVNEYYNPGPRILYQRNSKGFIGGMDLVELRDKNKQKLKRISEDERKYRRTILVKARRNTKRV